MVVVADAVVNIEEEEYSNLVVAVAVDMEAPFEEQSSMDLMSLSSCCWHLEMVDIVVVEVNVHCTAHSYSVELGAMREKPLHLLKSHQS